MSSAGFIRISGCSKVVIRHPGNLDSHYICSHSLDQLDHYVLTCKHGGDVVSRGHVRHSVMVFWDVQALVPKLMLEVDLRHEGKYTRPADIFIPLWEMDKTSSFDTSITSIRYIQILQAGVLQPWQQTHKHATNGAKVDDANGRAALHDC